MDSEGHRFGAMNKDLTTKYYDNNADKFIKDTLDVNLESLYSKFLPLLTPKAAILDAGCGSGRDSLYFIRHRYRVTAFDSSSVLAERSSELIGQKVLTLSFDEVDFDNQFDGIWACASLLHIPKAQIHACMERLIRAMKSSGVIFMSFKYGTGETIKDERFFNNYDEESFANMIGQHSKLTLVSTWVTNDLRKGREHEKWLNGIARKSA